MTSAEPATLARVTAPAARMISRRPGSCRSLGRSVSLDMIALRGLQEPGTEEHRALPVVNARYDFKVTWHQVLLLVPNCCECSALAGFSVVHSRWTKSNRHERIQGGSKCRDRRRINPSPCDNPARVAVGTRITPRPPHRSRRALLT